MMKVHQDEIKMFQKHAVKKSEGITLLRK